MRRTLLAVLMVGLVSTLSAQRGAPLRVFVSVDMEGISGVVNWEEVDRSGKDYDYFRRLMTKEASAAVEGALAAGATEILVRDSHGSARNILPEELHPAARLLRDWSGGFKGMMEGIDETFSAVIFVGYHAKAGTPNALLEHTMSGNIADLSINGISLPEAGLNALIAGHYNVPVVFVAGDKAICEQVKQLLGNVETVAVKEGIGNAALCLHPEVAREKIRQGVTRALQNLTQYKPFKLKAPYTMVLKLKREELVHEKSLYPGAKRTGDWELTFTSNDLLEVVKAFDWMH
ncbi:MAG: M55 family metallopeptidase [candidate division KSB1 bacterium]|nr:M55 family metallopeptidase [candidate division KSB1 bacterium]MDZ7414220.1 M55 family metallopeptidase [candidate division KSB1 bacterium]